MSKNQIFGSCRHIKGVYDTHPSCINCTGCGEDDKCPICQSWPESAWAAFRKRRTHKGRRSKSSKSSSAVHDPLSDSKASFRAKESEEASSPESSGNVSSSSSAGSVQDSPVRNSHRSRGRSRRRSTPRRKASPSPESARHVRKPESTKGSDHSADPPVLRSPHDRTNLEQTVQDVQSSFDRTGQMGDSSVPYDRTGPALDQSSYDRTGQPHRRSSMDRTDGSNYRASSGQRSPFDRTGPAFDRTGSGVDRTGPGHSGHRSPGMNSDRFGQNHSVGNDLYHSNFPQSNVWNPTTFPPMLPPQHSFWGPGQQYSQVPPGFASPNFGVGPQGQFRPPAVGPFPPVSSWPGYYHNSGQPAPGHHLARSPPGFSAEYDRADPQVHKRPDMTGPDLTGSTGKSVHKSRKRKSSSSRDFISSPLGDVEHRTSSGAPVTTSVPGPSSSRLPVQASGHQKLPIMGFDWPSSAGTHQDSRSHSKAPGESERSTSVPSHDTSREADTLSLHPNENDPLIQESRSNDPMYTARKVDRSSSQSNHADHSSQSNPGDQSAQGSDEEAEPEVELPRFSFSKAVQEVFRLLPENVCPRIPTPKAESFQGFLDLDDSKSTTEDSDCFLPMPPSVKAMADAINEDVLAKVDSSSWPSWAPPSSLLTKKLRFHPYFYKFSREPFPTSLPSLDSDASRLGIRQPSSLQIPLKHLERWETRSRQLLGVSAYNNAFTAALNSALKNPSEVDPESIKLLLDALNKTSIHSMGLSVCLSAEIFKLRREGHIPPGNALSANSRRKLRSVPLSSDSIFGRTIAEVSQGEKDDRLLVPPKPRVQENKRNFPKKKGGGNPNYQAKKPKLAPSSTPSKPASGFSPSPSQPKSNQQHRKFSAPKPKTSFPPAPKGSQP